MHTLATLCRCAVMVAITAFAGVSHSSTVVNDNTVPLAVITSNTIELIPAKVGNVVPVDFLLQTAIPAVSDNVEKVVSIVLPKLSFTRLVYDANYNKQQSTKSLGHALETKSSVVYPFVSDIKKFVSSFGSTATTLHVGGIGDIKDGDILTSQRHVQIKIAPTVSLHDADAIFGHVFKLLNTSNQQFSIIYTAEESDEWITGIPGDIDTAASEQSFEEGTLIRYRRQAAAPPKADPKFTLFMYGDTCFQFYATEITVMISNAAADKVNATLPVKTVNQTSALKCTKTSSPSFKFTVSYGKVGDFDSLSLTIGVSNKTAGTSDWSVSFITLEYSTTKMRSPGNFTLKPTWLTAPRKFSYHCNYPENLVQTDTATKTKATLSFGTIQVQAYDIKDAKFEYPCDCVGFFTSAIWAGIVVTAIYLLIIALAIVMLVNLETMDRFEDPKGQALKIQSTG